MTNQELATAVQYDLPVKILIMNNGYLGMVRQWQEMFYDRTYSEVDISVAPDFVKLAEAYGAAGFRAERPDQLHDVLEATALSHKASRCRYCRFERGERVSDRAGGRDIERHDSSNRR
jgi:acetolactate synthase-1/2/3 large subunit